MKKDFDKTCEGCPNHAILSDFAEQCEVLEAAVSEDSNLKLVNEGRVGCRGALGVFEDELGGGHTCRAEKPTVPEIQTIIMRSGGLVVTTETQVHEVPELEGQDVMIGGHHITSQKLPISS